MRVLATIVSLLYKPGYRTYNSSESPPVANLPKYLSQSPIDHAGETQ